MTDWTLFADAEDSIVSLEPGVFRGEGLRNNGPAVLFKNGSGGVAVVAPDKATLVTALRNALSRIEALPEPAPDSTCRNCGHAIRYPNTENGAYWVHRPFTSRWVNFEDWEQDCSNDEGDYVMNRHHVLMAQPASDAQAIAQPGDLVIDMYAVEQDYPEVDQVRRVWEVQPGGVIVLDNDHLRRPEQVLVLTPFSG